MTKRARLNEIVKCCETRFDRGDVSTWKHGEFVDLSREIQRETHANLSPNTLKRIFGKIAVDDDYIPQQATLDALKKYGRYTEREVSPPEQEPEPVPQPVPIPDIQRPGSSNIFYIVIAVIALLTSLLIWQFLKPKNISGKIRITRTEGHLPSTTTFDLEVPETKDSLFVNFGDKSPLVYITPGKKAAAHLYYFPGYFTASIQTRNKVLFATTNVNIKSDSWIGLVFHNQQDIPNQFNEFPAFKTGRESVFRVSNKDFFKMGLDTTGLLLTRLCNYTPEAYNLDDFIFETTFQNTLLEKNIYCRGTQFQLSGSKGMIRFKFVNPGCSLRVINIVSEQTFNGAVDDLSSFVLDLKRWNTVKLINHYKRLSLYVNDKQIFSGSYQKPLGDLRGLFLEFEGAGLVKNCLLKSADGKVIYHF